MYMAIGPPPDNKSQEIYDLFFEICKTLDDCKEAKKRLIEEYGEEDANIIIYRVVGYYRFTSTVYQCWDCMALDDLQYAEKTGWDLDEFYSWKPGQKQDMKMTFH